VALPTIALWFSPKCRSRNRDRNRRVQYLDSLPNSWKRGRLSSLAGSWLAPPHLWVFSSAMLGVAILILIRPFPRSGARGATGLQRRKRERKKAAFSQTPLL